MFNGISLCFIELGPLGLQFSVELDLSKFDHPLPISIEPQIESVNGRGGYFIPQCTWSVFIIPNLILASPKWIPSPIYYSIGKTTFKKT